MANSKLRIVFPYSLLATHYSHFAKRNEAAAQVVVPAFSLRQAKEKSEAERRQK
jgi:hypothetical protein